MGQFYTAGEKKARPGVYQRYSNNGGSVGAGALNGVVAIAMEADWGPCNEVTVHEGRNSVIETYGSGTGVDAALAAFDGGATTLYINRVGTAAGDTGYGKATLAIAGDEELTVTAAYPGKRALTIDVKRSLVNTDEKEVSILEKLDGQGTKELEKFLFAANPPSKEGDSTTPTVNEAKNLVAALEESKYVTATTTVTAASVVIEESTDLLSGINPTVTKEDYTTAFAKFEPYRFNVLVTDKSDITDIATMKAYIDEAYNTGKMIMGVAACKDGNIDLTVAPSLNSEKICYVGNGFIDMQGNEVYGAKLACLTAGVIASTPSNASIVHKSVPGAVDVADKLTNAQYESAINAGTLMLSVGPNGAVWFDSGITTLINPAENQDDGWKKIRRVKTRFEVLDRIDSALAPRVGKVNCDADGILSLIQTGTGVLKEMAAEGKIQSNYSMYTDPANPYGGDSAWFIIEVDDIDSLERVYLQYMFRYSQNV